ncbi:MAG: hypothetical protein ACK504_12145 [Bacteroidota bacterium]|jgi:hypothetical protein
MPKGATKELPDIMLTRYEGFCVKECVLLILRLLSQYFYFNVITS